MLKYRQAYSNEYTKIAAFLGRKGYSLMDPSRMGGHWIVAVDEDAEYVHGCIWFFGERPNAYVDYLAADYPRVAATLCYAAMVALQKAGMRYVRGVVLTKNESAARFLTKGFGMASHSGYDLLFKELERSDYGIPRGRTDPHRHDDDTRSERPGSSTPKIIAATR